MFAVVRESLLSLLRQKKKLTRPIMLPHFKKSRISVCSCSFSSLCASSSCHTALLSFLLIYQTSSSPCCHIWYRWLGSMEWPVSLHLASSEWQQARWLVKGPRLSPAHGHRLISQRGSHASLPIQPAAGEKGRTWSWPESQEWKTEKKGWEVS